MKSVAKGLGLAAIIIGLIGIFGWLMMPVAWGDIWLPIIFGAICIGGYFLRKYGGKIGEPTT